MSSSQPDRDQQIRLAAFEALRGLNARFQEAIPWNALDRGFTFQGEKIRFANQAVGIFKPRSMESVLSIKSVIPKRGRPRRYLDQFLKDMGDGAVTYDLAKGARVSHYNGMLREALDRSLPLIYFQGVAPARYLAHFPVYVVEWDGSAGNVLLDVGLPNEELTAPLEQSDERREHVLAMTRIRYDQAQFRFDVLKAYGERCAVTGTGSQELVVAAHIRPYAEGGPSKVSNGLCLNHLHHAAYDTHLLGIDADRRLHVADRLRAVSPSQFVQEGFMDLEGHRIELPRHPELHPDPDLLDERFQQFRMLDS